MRYHDAGDQVTNGNGKVGPPAFYRVGQPYCDFMAAAELRQGLFREPPELKDFCSTMVGPRVRLYSPSEVFAHLDVGMAVFIGMANADGTFWRGLRHLPFDRMPRPPVIGICTILEHRREHLAIRGDFLGMSPLFYYCENGLALVSNRFHLMCLVLKACGRYALNMAAYNAFYYAGNPFSTQLATFATPAVGVYLAMSGATLTLCSGGQLNVVEHRDPPREIVTPTEYHRLIERGAEDVISSIECLFRSPGTPLVKAAITGGRDSRAVMGGLIAAGRHKDVQFTTHKRGRDIEIATGLVKHFGGSYAPKEKIVGYVDVPFSDLRRRSRHFGLYHYVRFPPLRRYHAAAKRKRYVLNGFCGELYRAFYPKRGFQSWVGVDVDDQRRLLECSSRQRRFDDETFKLTIKLLDETFRHLDGRTLDERLDEHYREFRARIHFGSCMVGGSGWSPLMSPSLLAAARGLPFEEYASGRVIFDVTRALCDQLAYLPYEHAMPNFATSRYHRPSSYDNRSMSLEPAPELLSAGDCGERRRFPSAPKPPNRASFFATGALAAFDEVSARGIDIGTLDRSGLVRRIAWMQRRSLGELERQYSKLVALRDYAILASS